MRFTAIQIRDLGPFAERNVQFDQLDGKLTAITGVNGAGKSTLLELLLGGVYRGTPTRGSLMDLAHGRQAMLQVDLEHAGHAYRFHHLIDKTGRKSDASILRDGAPALSSGKVSALDAFVQKRMPDLGVLLVTQFAAQKSGGFIDTKPAERKSLLLKIQGVDQLEELAARARARLSMAQQETERRQAALDNERLRSGDPAGITTELAEQRDQQALADEVLRLAIVAVANAKTAGERSRECLRLAAAWRAQREEIQAEIERCRARYRRVRELIVKDESLVLHASEIRAAVERVRAIAAELIELTAERRGLQGSDVLAKTETNLLTAQRQRHQGAYRTAEQMLMSRASIERDERELPIGVRKADDMKAELAMVSAQLEEIQAKGLVSAEGRIVRLRSGLVRIEKLSNLEEGDHRPIARKVLDQDDAAETDAKEVPAQLRKLTADRDLLAKDLEARQRLNEQLRQSAGRRDALNSAQRDHEAATKEIAVVDARLREIASDYQARGTRLADVGVSIQQLESESNKLHPLTAQSVDLERAATEIAILKPELEQIEAEAAPWGAKLQALGVEPACLPAPPLTELAAAEALAGAAVTQATAKVITLEHRLGEAQAAAERIQSMQATVSKGEQEVADWRRLSADLGKDGLQAALSDAALPELVALTNTLLHSAFGPRWTVDVRSQAVDAKGKRMLETLDVVVIDTVRGREDLAETYSGGELAIISEGLSLALTVLACRTNGVTRPTLVRDESGAALSAENARAWVAMLRRAVEMVGADRLLFVSHSPEITALADSVVAL